MKGGGDYQECAWRWVEMVVSERGLGGWGEGGGAVGGGCDSPLLIRNGGKMCSLTNNCVAHNL